MKTKLPRILSVTLAVTLLVLATNQAKAHTITYIGRANNNTGMTVYDLHIAFVGAGGQITDPRILEDGGPGQPTITTTSPSGSEINITWDDGGLAAGNFVKFAFEDPYRGVRVIGIPFWTDQNGNRVADARVRLYTAPEKWPTFLLFGLALLGLALAGTWTRIHWPRPSQ